MGGAEREKVREVVLLIFAKGVDKSLFFVVRLNLLQNKHYTKERLVVHEE
jgi:hypothetical protein